MKRIAFVALGVGFAFALCGYLATGESEAPRILRPLDKSVLPFGPVEIAVIVLPGSDPPPILLDKKKLELSLRPRSDSDEGSASSPSGSGVFLAPALVVVCSVSPGSHTLSAGGTTVQFFLRDEEGKKVPPGGWLPYAPHPPAGAKEITCVDCHTLSEGRRFVNMNSEFSLEKPSGCFDCHERSEFNLTHNHRYESLAFCQMCHDPHGATGEHLLRIPKEKACSLCHD